MANPPKRKGDHAELEVASQLRSLTGWPVTRKLGAGRREDTGDLAGIPDCTAQVKNYRDITRAIREAVPELEAQHANGATTFAVAFIRRPGGRFIAVQTLEQWATSHREAVGLCAVALCGRPASAVRPDRKGIARPVCTEHARIMGGMSLP